MNILDIGLAAGISGTADTYWRNEEQAAVNTMWDNSTQATTVQMQAAISSTTYNTYDAQVLPSVEPSSFNYYRDSDSSMKFIFKDINTSIIKGSYIIYNNEYWLINYKHSHATVQAYCYAIRCDATLKYYNGRDILTQPIKVYDNFSAEIESRNKFIMVQKNNLKIVTQDSEMIKSALKINRRFILGGEPYKVISIDRVHNETNLVYAELMNDEIHEQDNLTTGIAYNSDTIDKPQDIDLIPDFDTIRVGQKIKFSGHYDNYYVYAESLSPQIRVYENTDPENDQYRWVAEGVLPTKTATIKLTANIPGGSLIRNHTVRVTSRIG